MNYYLRKITPQDGSEGAVLETVSMSCSGGYTDETHNFYIQCDDGYYRFWERERKYRSAMWRSNCCDWEFFPKQNVDILIETQNFQEFARRLHEENIVFFKPYAVNDDIDVVYETTDFSAEELEQLISLNKIRVRKLGFPNEKNAILEVDAGSNKLGLFSKCEGAYGSKGFFDWYDKHIADYTNSKILDENDLSQINECRRNINKSIARCAYFVDTDGKDVLKISKILCKATPEEERPWVVHVSATTEMELLYNINREGNKCVKYTKKGEKPISVFDFFANIKETYMYNFVFKGYRNEHEFFLANQLLLTRCGFFNFATNFRRTSTLITLFVQYISVAYEYPSIELLTKGNYMSLVDDIFEEIIKSRSKQAVKEKVQQIGELINGNASNGKECLRFPAYIGDYLRRKNAGFNSYILWRDIYELENLSNGEFENIINMPELALLNIDMNENEKSTYKYYFDMGWEDLGFQEIIKHDGWTTQKTLRYVVKQALNTYFNDDKNHGYGRYGVYRDMVIIIRDTLQMCEELNIALEPYPSDIMQVHNEVAALYKEHQDGLGDSNMYHIAEACTEVLNSCSVPKELAEKFVFRFPICQKEFVQEGLKQHNCVAGYFGRVLKGEMVIFFVRKKEEPDNSYITAEIRKGGLRQVMYSNNRCVSNSSDEFAFCQWIANKILSSYRKGGLEILDKISK